MKTKSYRFSTCEGNIYIMVNHNNKGEFDSIQIYPPAKNNNCGYSWAFALQDLVTFALRRVKDNDDIRLIIKSIAGHNCNAMPPNKQHCKSCVDALSKVVKENFLIKE